MIKKADILLLIFILIFGIGVSYWSLLGNSSGENVLITVDGHTYGIYPLSTDDEITVTHGNHTNHITIKDGKVSMTYSSCKNQVCVHSAPISSTKDVIVCLPNRVIIEIQGSSKQSGGDVDVISG